MKYKMEKQFLNSKVVSDYIGDSSQIGGTQKLIVDEGKGKGTSIVRVRNGNGLDFSVVPDRGLDIFDIHFDGVQLAWISRNGLVANSFFDFAEYALFFFVLALTVLLERKPYSAF